MLSRDIADQLGDDHRLADAGAAEDARLAALRERGDQVNDLNASFEDFNLRRLLFERRGRAVNRAMSWPLRPVRLDRSARRRR